jgi:hypothetical protein
VSSPITDSRLSIPVGPLEAREKWGYVFWGILGAVILHRGAGGVLVRLSDPDDLLDDRPDRAEPPLVQS